MAHIGRLSLIADGLLLFGATGTWTAFRPGSIKTRFTTVADLLLTLRRRIRKTAGHALTGSGIRAAPRADRIMTYLTMLESSTIYAGNDKTTVVLEPAGDNRMTAKGSFKVGVGVRVALTVTLAGKSEAKANFNLK